MSKYLFIGIEALIERADPISQPFDFYYRPSVFQSLSTICSETDVKIILLVEENVTHDEKRLTEKISSDLIRQDILNEIVYSSGLTDIQNPLLSRFTLSGSYSIGLTDNLSNFAGERVITVLNENEAINWKGIAGLLANTSRIATVRRKTNETDITIQLNLDGNGNGVIKTGLAFFDHMLDQVKRHGNLDLSITALGDLHIDEHHTIEDVGLALGEAFYKALGNKKGIERYGFLLPMDDCLAQVAIDFGGRPWLVWNVPFTREKIGDMPTEMFMHFFKSFSDNAKCNLNIKAEGSNEHHKIEAVFKAFAKAIGAAVAKTGKNNIPSTKGSL